MKKLLLMSGLALSTGAIFLPMAQAAPYNYAVRRENRMERREWRRENRNRRVSIETAARRVRDDLRNDRVLSRFKLDTDTVDRHIEVEGTVNTLAQRRRAVAIARRNSAGYPVFDNRIKVR